jgi:L-rhamnose mutarotase
MRRQAFRMRLKPGTIDEYRRRHDEIWPELVAGLREAGISDYTIFHEPETNSLFAVRIVRDDDRLAEFMDSPVFRRWREYMLDIMESDAEGNAVASTRLTEVFHMD